MKLIVIALLALLLCSIPALAQDADGDGIPDAVEADLGSSVQRAQEFTRLAYDGSAKGGDRSLSSSFADAPDFLEIGLANIAADRWLFRVTFAGDYVADGNTFILYLDMDRDLGTGRQDVKANQGTDIMYVQQNGKFTTAEHTKGLQRGPARLAVVDNTLYISTDAAIGEGNADGKLRFKALSHVSPPKADDSDTMDWVVVDLPPVVGAVKPRIGPPLPEPPLSNLATDQPDADRDGIPDGVELALGSNVELAEPMYLVLDDGVCGVDDRTVREAREVAPDVTRVHFGNVGQDRYIWKLEFAEDFVGPGTVLILYLDADNRTDTGRQDFALGVDVMLTCVDGGFAPTIINAGVAGMDRRLRGIIDGKSVWMSMDLRMNHTEDGHTETRAHVLCHRRPETSDADFTEWFVHYGPGESDRPKPRAGSASEFRSENLKVEMPWLGWRDDLRRLQVIDLPAAEAQLEGMRLFDRAVVPERPGATATFVSPADGRFHLCFVVQDSAVGDETLTVDVAGTQVARAVAAENDGLFHLYTTLEPVQLAKGQPIRFTAQEPAQDFQVSEVFLAASAPKPRDLEISHLSAYCAPDQRGELVNVDICWLTNYPDSAAVIWGPGDQPTRRQESPIQGGYSHRVTLAGLRRGEAYCARVETAGGRLRSELVRFVAEPLSLEAGTARRESVRLHVGVSEGAGSGGWPVEGGVPLPSSALASVEHCRVINAAGQPVPASFRALGWWPDGSIKWVLVSLPDGAGGPFELEYGEEVQADSPQLVTVAEDEAGLTVSTGILQARISRNGFAPPGEVRVDLNGDGRFAEDEVVAPADQPGIVLTDKAGKRYTSKAGPVDLRWEEIGPTRAVLLAEGPLQAEDGGKLMRYRCRMTFHAGFAGIPTVFTLINGEGASAMPPTMTAVKSLSLTMNTGQGNQAPTRVLQDYDSHTVTTEGDTRTESEGRPLGVISAQGENARATLCLRDFWQLYPKAISRSENGELSLGLLPELPADQYAQHTDPKLKTQHYYWFRDGAYQVPCGVALSHDILFHFASPDQSPDTVAAQWQATRLLAAEPEHYCASGALMDIAPEKEGLFTSFQDYVRRGLARINDARERVREYSYMNFGDWYGERGVNWGNQEYDLQWGLLLQFARSGDLAFFDRAEEASRHMAAVDIINASPQQNQVGRVHIHGLGHTGGFGMERVPGSEFWIDSGGHDIGHTWTQGTYATYCLTGDRRHLESAELVADWMATAYTQSLQDQIHRNYGWATLAVLGGYAVKADPYLLNAARLFCDHMVARQDPGTGVWAHAIGECEHKPQHMGGKVFMSGVDMTALRTLDLIEPRDDLKHAIARNCDWMYTRMWHPDENNFQYAQCTQFDKSSTHAGTWMACEGLAYAYELTRDDRYREMLVRSLGDSMQRGPGGEGKTYAMQIRMVPYALAILERLGMDELPLPPPPAPEVTWDRGLYLSPAGGRVALYVNNRATTPVAARAKVVSLPEGLAAANETTEWTAAPGRAAGPVIGFTGKAQDGAKVVLEYEVGQVRGKAEIPVRNAVAVEIGQGAGYIGVPPDPLGLALGKLGIDLPVVEKLDDATLAEFGGLIIGAEAHFKGFAGLKQNPYALADFVLSGGRVAILQLQDSDYETGYLPFDIQVHEDASSLGRITLPDHPLFTRPNRVESLSGAVEYDRLTGAGAGWQVLAVDAGGAPAIIHAKAGKGEVVVVQASVDRYITGEVSPAGTLRVEDCEAFLRNLVEWVRGRG